MSKLLSPRLTPRMPTGMWPLREPALAIRRLQPRPQQARALLGRPGSVPRLDLLDEPSVLLDPLPLLPPLRLAELSLAHDPRLQEQLLLEPRLLQPQPHLLHAQELSEAQPDRAL